MMNLDRTLHVLPASGRPTLLYIYLHGVGAGALQMAPVADRFAQAWPHAVHLMPEGFDAFGEAADGRQWFSRDGITEENRPERVAAAVMKLTAFVNDAQRHFGIEFAATALVGFSQGAVVALEAVQREPALAGRVVALGGRYARLPEAAPPSTVLHLVHGKDDAVVPARHAVEAAARLVALGGDVTADVIPGVGHALDPELIERAVLHLQTYLPRRVWAEALAAAPVHSTPASSRDFEPPSG
jgi:phospholipase/carboxylesterase